MGHLNPVLFAAFSQDSELGHPESIYHRSFSPAFWQGCLWLLLWGERGRYIICVQKEHYNSSYLYNAPPKERQNSRCFPSTSQSFRSLSERTDSTMKGRKIINKSCFKSHVNICSWAHPTQKYILLFLVRVTMHLCILCSHFFSKFHISNSDLGGRTAMGTGKKSLKNKE